MLRFSLHPDTWGGVFLRSERFSLLQTLLVLYRGGQLRTLGSRKERHEAVFAMALIHRVR